MATRPWVNPEEVKNYTEYAEVAGRQTGKLMFDIARAEEYVIAYTNNKFSDVDAVPGPVKMAVILLAEAYAYNAKERSARTSRSTSGGRMKSETYDDYSYTFADGESLKDTLLDESALGLGTLLDGFVIAQGTGKINFRMRKL